MQGISGLAESLLASQEGLCCMELVEALSSLSIIFPFVLYGCETWSLTLREERKLRVFENRVLGRILGPRRDEVTREWRKLH